MNRTSPVDRRERVLLRRLRQAIRGIEVDTDLDALAEAVEDGDIARVEDVAGVGSDDWAIAILVGIILAHLRVVMFDLAESLSQEHHLPFDSIDRRFQDWLEGKGSELRRDIAYQSRQVIESLMRNGQYDGRSARTTAALILSYRWILHRQLDGIERLRNRLIGSGLNRDAVRSALAGAVRSAQTRRTELVIATAITAAITKVTMTISADATASGTASGQLRWITERDELVCPICLPLDGVVQPIGSRWGELQVEGPPAHPLCRCHLENA